MISDDDDGRINFDLELPHYSPTAVCQGADIKAE